MMNFSEWVENRKLNESFTSSHQNAGDMIYFGAHDILNLPDDQLLDRSTMSPKISIIKAVGPKGVVVDRPQKHRFRNKSVKKFMCKDGGFTIPPDHLQEISPKLILDGEKENNAKLFIFTPNAYTKHLLQKKNARMMKADSPVNNQLQLPPPSYPYY